MSVERDGTLGWALHRVRMIYMTYGAPYVARFLIRRVCRLDRHVVYEKKLNDVTRPDWPTWTQLHIMERQTDIYAVPAIQANLERENVEYLEGIIGGSVTGIFVTDSNSIIHWAFMMRDTVSLELLDLNQKAIFLGNAYTDPSYRGKGLQKLSLRQRFYEAEKRGADTVYAEANPNNLVSRRGMEGAGMKFVRELSTLVILNTFVFRIHHSGSKAKRFCRMRKGVQR